MRRLRSATPELAAAVLQVLLVAHGRPPESPPRVAWASEAVKLAHHHHAVVLESFDFDAWAVLISCEARAS